MLALLSMALLLGAPPPPGGAKTNEVTRAERSARCTEDKWCGGGGTCTSSPTPEEPDRCVVGSDRECTIHPACETEGACHYDRKRRACVIKGPSSCADGAACRIRGLCKYVRELVSERTNRYETRCIATDETCARSLDCLLVGKCHADEVGQCVVLNDEDCRRSRGCESGGVCVRTTDPTNSWAWCTVAKDTVIPTPYCDRFGACDRDDAVQGCRDSEVCRALGWCALVPNPQHNHELVKTPCGTTDCAQSEVCRLHGACTAVDGLCVVRPRVEPECTRKRVLGFKATASSTRPPEAMGRFDAAHVADRDTRTAWVPAPEEAVGATLTLTLPRAERVVGVTIHAGSDMTDRHTDWRYHFTAPYAVKVTVGKVHELGYAMRWSRLPGDRIQVLVPPTQTDTVTIQLLMNTVGLIEDAPAIPEIFIEACAEP